MDRTERFYHIDRLLNERRVVPVQVFLEELEVSLATFKRDLEYLRERFNAPIVWDRDAGGYRFDAPSSGPRYELPGLWFNSSEVIALLTMQQLLRNLEPGLLAEHVEPLLARLQTILGEGNVTVGDIEKRIRFHRQAARVHDGKHFTLVATAVLQRKRLVIDHYVKSRDETITREVSPQRLTFYREAWYLDAWCHLRNELRSFALDAMKKVTLSKEPAKDVSDTEIAHILDGGYGIFSGKDIQWAELEFSAEQARWVSRETWHQKQQGHFEPDGSYRLTVPFSNPTELIMDILRHVPAVKVISPPELREQVRTMLKRGVESI
ncbi:transcriptional regulator [Thauera propionica]|uniref:Transcriptional regulator n=1 Tax=Thauera propionica TaxID=2019431 RepID=A0A235EZF2_9RHOO|nr:YafY family protein [Thauera propionica]OYD53805.1 transcriptional regulator [Thauera propionica]